MVSEAATYDEVRKGLWFSLEIEGEEFLAFIASEALNARFNSSRSKSSQLNAYKENRKLIHSIARQKFLSGASRPIRLDASDF